MRLDHTGIALGPALVIALLYYLSQSAWCAGVGFWTLYRPLIGGTLVGLVLGDPLRGAEVGAAINLAYIGFVATGGALPSDISLAGYLGTALAIANNLDTAQVLALTVPVGMLGYLVYQLRMTLDGLFVHRADRCAARGDSRGVAFWNVWPPQALLLVLSGVPCFLALHYGPSLLQAALAGIPRWLNSALLLAGALLPAVGIASILSLLWRRANPAWFVLGFVVAALAPIPMLPFAAGALALACIVQRESSRGAGALGAERANGEGDGPLPAATASDEGGCATGALIRSRDRWASWLAWLFFSHACYSFERMQGPGFCHGLIPVLRRLYAEGSDGMAAALQRHMVYYNSEPNLGAITNGMTAALEVEHAAGLDRAVLRHKDAQGRDLAKGPRVTQGDAVTADSIVALKAGLMGPLSGVGDTLVQGTLAPLLLSLGIGLAATAPLVGAMFYGVAICVVIWGMGYAAYAYGYRRGASLVRDLARRGRVDEAVRLLEATGAAVLGYLAATRLRIPLDLLAGGEGAVNLGHTLDTMMPGALSLVLVLAGVALLRRGVAQMWLALGGLVAGGAIGALIGLIA